MQERRGAWARVGLSALVLLGLGACAAKTPGAQANGRGRLEDVETPMPTVPPSRTVTPEATPVALRTRPVGTGAKAGKGELIGPEVSFFGAARADGTKVEPESVDKNGVPTYRTAVGSGFMLVVEGKPGKSGLEPGMSVFAYDAKDPKIQPDLQIQSSRDMGDGSVKVCDKRKPIIGGIPAVNPMSFAETQKVSDALNDFSCRFETFIESSGSCTMMPNGDYAFVNKDTATQFCMIVARAWAFPIGTTTLSVRLRDSDGNPGPTKQMRIHRPAEVPTPRPAPAPAKK